MQSQNISRDTIYWDNGNISFLPELGTVIIVLKKGSNVKDARLVEIKKQKGILTYEKEKCLHDVYISNIKRVEPGKNALSHLVFTDGNTPYIKKQYTQMDAMIKYSDFKSTKIVRIEPEPVKEEKQAAVPVQPIIQDKQIQTRTSNDTIIEENGRIILARIIDIDANFVSYKKVSNPNGPVYIKSVKGGKVTKYANCSSVNYIKE